MTSEPRHPASPAAAHDHEMLRLVARLLPPAVGAERCGIFIRNPRTNTVWAKIGTGIDERAIEVPMQGSIVGRAISMNRILVAEGLDAANGLHKAIDASTHFTTRNLLCVPIPATGGGEPVGAIEILNKVDGHFTEADQATVTEIAGVLSRGLERFYLSQDVEGMVDRLRGRSHAAQWVAAAAVVLFLGLAGAMQFLR